MSHLPTVRFAGLSNLSRCIETFRRIVFSGPQLQQLSVDGPFYDQRIKLIFPNTAGVLPDIEDAPDWYQRWLAMPEAERGVCGLFNPRLTRDDGITRMTVDLCAFCQMVPPGRLQPGLQMR